jgi:hypothetical protein
MKALIFENKVVDLAATEFEVCDSMSWMDAPEGCQVGWSVTDGAIQLTNIAKERRQRAYSMEADPLFFKAQRGEATTDEWTAKVAEIKARFPYPGGEE